MLIYAVINSFFFSIIFWSLLFLFKFFYSNELENSKLNFYECGFTGVMSTKIQNNVNLVLSWLFLIIYEAEIILLTPVCLVFIELHNNFVLHFFLIIFIVFYLMTLLYDCMFSVLEWQI